MCLADLWLWIMTNPMQHSPLQPYFAGSCAHEPGLGYGTRGLYKDLFHYAGLLMLKHPRG